MLWLSVALAASPSIDEPPVSGARAPSDYAVVIANQDYASFPDVAYAARDADAFSAWLTRTRGVPPVNVIRLNGATRKKMEDAVTRAATLVPAGGTLWVYYSGHGLGMRLGADAAERVLVGINAVPSADEIGENVVSVAALERIAGRSPAAHSVFLVDSCFNNKDASGQPIVRGSFAVPSGRPTAQSKVTVWTAASEDETARWYEPARHGAFTYFAVGALSGWADGVAGATDGEVTLGEAQAWVQRAMSSAGILDQNPDVIGDASVSLARGKLAAAPSTGFGVADAGVGSGGTVGQVTRPQFDVGDLSAQIAAQACDDAAAALAQTQFDRRVAAEQAHVVDAAAAGWVKLKPQLDACVSLSDRSMCVSAVDKFLASARAAQVVVPASVEVVDTNCGKRSRAVPGRTVAVAVPQIAEADAYRARLVAQVAPSRGGATVTSQGQPRVALVDPGQLMTTYNFSTAAIEQLRSQLANADDAIAWAHESKWPSGISTFNARETTRPRFVDYVVYQAAVLTGGNVLLRAPIADNQHMPTGMRPTSHDLYFMIGGTGVKSAPSGVAAARRSAEPRAYLENSGEMMSTYTFSSELRDQVRAQLADADQAIAWSHESEWPSGITTLDGRNAVRSKFADYTVYIAATWTDTVLLRAPVAENQHMPVGMRPTSHDIFFVVGTGGVRR
jgi:hypothetical protein